MLHTPSNLTTDPFSILLGHNRWATRRLIEHSASLTADQFHERFDIGLCSLHDTLLHITGAVRGWAGSIARQLPAPATPWPERPSIGGGKSLTTPLTDRDPADVYTPNRLLAVHEDVCADFATVVEHARACGALVRTENWTFGTTTYRFTVTAAIIHVTNHGMHHRAQCMNMLRRLGHPIHADLDELEWQVAGEP